MAGCSKNFLKVIGFNAEISLLNMCPNKIFLSAGNKFFKNYITRVPRLEIAFADQIQSLNFHVILLPV